MEGTLENYGNELLTLIEQLKQNKTKVHAEILREENEIHTLKDRVVAFSQRIEELDESVTRKVQTRSEYDEMIAEAESAYAKILESTQSLVHTLKRETSLLAKKASALAHSAGHCDATLK